MEEPLTLPLVGRLHLVLHLHLPQLWSRSTKVISLGSVVSLAPFLLLIGMNLENKTIRYLLTKMDISYMDFYVASMRVMLDLCFCS